MLRDEEEGQDLRHTGNTIDDGRYMGHNFSYHDRRYMVHSLPTGGTNNGGGYEYEYPDERPGVFGRIANSFRRGGSERSWDRFDHVPITYPHEEKSKSRRHLKTALCCALLLVLVAAAVALGIVLTKHSGSKSSDQTGSSETQEPAGASVCAGPTPTLSDEIPAKQSINEVPLEAKPASKSRIVVRFGQKHDPFVSQAAKEANIKADKVTRENLASIWKKAKPTAGWIDSSHDELLPSLLKDTSVANLNKLVRFFYATSSRTYILEYPTDEICDSVLSILEKASGGDSPIKVPGDVEWVYKDKRALFVQQGGAPKLDDPYLSEQWALKKVDVEGSDASDKGAWAVVQGDADIVVAVIDTGIDLNHPDLTNVVWQNPNEVEGNSEDDDGNGYADDIHGWNFVADSPDVTDDHGHGSHCSGIIAATSNNREGIAGVAQVHIMPLKVLDANGEGVSSSFIRALEYAITNNAHITSNSYGGPDRDQRLGDQIKAAETAGQLLVAAAGNYGSDNDQKPVLPASEPNPIVLSVAASDSNDCIANFSNYGKSSVHVAAPGVMIASTYKDGQYFYMSGTSQAAPHAAGAAALVMAALKMNDKPWQGQGVQIKQFLMNSVDTPDTLQQYTVSGGRLNIEKAIALATGS